MTLVFGRLGLRDIVLLERNRCCKEIGQLVRRTSVLIWRLMPFVCVCMCLCVRVLPSTISGFATDDAVPI